MLSPQRVMIETQEFGIRMANKIDLDEITADTPVKKKRKRGRPKGTTKAAQKQKMLEELREEIGDVEEYLNSFKDDSGEYDDNLVKKTLNTTVQEQILLLARVKRLLPEKERYWLLNAINSIKGGWVEIQKEDKKKVAMEEATIEQLLSFLKDKG